MNIFKEKTFTLPALTGISAKTIEEHLKLYSAYVKNLNLIQEIIERPETPEYACKEAYRRQAFEFGGMRNHEYYFGHFEGGPRTLSAESPLHKALTVRFGSFERAIESIKDLALTRGIGWAMLGYDKATNQLITYWVDEQHLGHLPQVTPLLCLDMWEHSFVADYQPSGKKKYVEDFFVNINWSTVENHFSSATK